MRALGLAWPGTLAEDPEGKVASLRDAPGSGAERTDGDFAIPRLPGGEAVEVFGPLSAPPSGSPRARSWGSG